LQAHRHHLENNKDMLEVFDSIMKMYEEDISQPCEQTLIHNDLDIKNIIVDPLTGKLHGIIDFTDAAFDDVAFDLRMRRNNPIEFVRAVSLVYAMINKSPQNAQKLYGYYFATEFSRYFEQIESGKIAEAQKTFNEIIKSIRDFLKSHDDCKDENCAHGTSEEDAVAA
jgi:thiamine kinase-like enzyme